MFTLLNVMTVMNVFLLKKLWSIATLVLVGLPVFLKEGTTSTFILLFILENDAYEISHLDELMRIFFLFRDTTGRITDYFETTSTSNSNSSHVPDPSEAGTFS